MFIIGWNFQKCAKYVGRLCQKFVETTTYSYISILLQIKMKITLRLSYLGNFRNYAFLLAI